jgi:hypothetical protein
MTAPGTAAPGAAAPSATGADAAAPSAAPSGAGADTGAGTAGLGGAPEAGAGAGGSAAPNMHGDAFGSGRPLQAMLSVPSSPGSPSSSSSSTLVRIVNPSGGGVVGRTKISDDNNPLPRDRVISDYDYFNSVPLSRSHDVHRFSPGFEKTFLDGLASIEVRIPFAATLSNDLSGGSLSDENVARFGDVHVTLKGLAYCSEKVSISGGLGIGLPTAIGARASVGGAPLLHISDDAVILTPFIAALLTPSDRCFAQVWYQVGFDANGNRVEANLDGSGLRAVGRINDQTLSQLDAQVGYWVYRCEDGTGCLRGVAPFLELHWNAALSHSDVIQSGSFLLGDQGSNFSELNVCAGVTSQLWDHFLLTLGAVFPLRSQSNRSFDYQLGIHGSVYFGRGLRNCCDRCEECASTF